MNQIILKFQQLTANGASGLKGSVPKLVVRELEKPLEINWEIPTHLVVHGNDSSCLLLLEVGDEVPEWPGLDVRTVVLDLCGCGESEEDGVRRWVAHPLRHVVKFVLVQPETLSDLQIGRTTLVFQGVGNSEKQWWNKVKFSPIAGCKFSRHLRLTTNLSLAGYYSD